MPRLLSTLALLIVVGRMCPHGAAEEPENSKVNVSNVAKFRFHDHLKLVQDVNGRAEIDIFAVGVDDFPEGKSVNNLINLAHVLQLLGLRSEKIDDSHLKGIEALRNLRILSLDKTSNTDRAFVQIGKVKSLSTLRRCKTITYRLVSCVAGRMR